MGLWSTLFGGRRRYDLELLEKLLERDLKRAELEGNIAARKAEFDLKLKELEVEHAETLQKVRTADREAKQLLREQRAANARKARDEAAKVRALGRTVSRDNCRVCHNPSEPSLQPEEISFHYAAGHHNAALPN